MVDGPQLAFPREKIQNREAILNFFEFVAFEAGHQGKAHGMPGRACEGLKRDFHNFLNILQNSWNTNPEGGNRPR